MKKLSDQEKISIQDFLTELVKHEVGMFYKYLNISPENQPTEEQIKLLDMAIRGVFSKIYPEEALFDLKISYDPKGVIAEFAMDFKVIEMMSAIHKGDFAANNKYLS